MIFDLRATFHNLKRLWSMPVVLDRLDRIEEKLDALRESLDLYDTRWRHQQQSSKDSSDELIDLLLRRLRLIDAEIEGINRQLGDRNVKAGDYASMVAQSPVASDDD